jgi:hypothetical protein
MSAVQLHYNKNDHPYTNTEHPRSVLCVYFSCQLFTTHASSFKDFKNFRSAQQMARLLQLLAYVIQNPHLAYVPGEDDPKYDAKDLKSVIPERAKEKYFTSSDGVYKTKTQQFIECVKAKDNVSVIGYRLWILSYDNCFDLATGVLNTILQMKRQKELSEKRMFLSTSIPTESEKYRHVVDLNCWSEGICDSYLKRQLMSAKREEIHNPSTPLNNQMNPAHPLNIFTLENSMLYAKQDGGQEVQCVIENYVNTFDGSYRFPYAERVWRIHSEQFDPRVLAVLQFPNHSRPGVGPSINGNIHDGTEFSESALGVLTTQYGFGRGELEQLKKSDLLLIAEMAKRDMDALLKRPIKSEQDEKDFVHSYHDLKYNKLLDFKKIWNENSNLSQISLNMIRWHNTLETIEREAQPAREFKVSREHIIHDTSLSVFGNMMAQRLLQYEKVLQTSTVHRELLIARIATYDAYRRSFGLHTNPLFTGSGSSSKSFILECIEIMSIPKTIQTITHITSKADAIDGNQNDLVTFFHEMPMALIGMDKNMSSQTGDPTFKERLTSCKYKTKMFHRDEETGKRSNRYAESECIGIIGGCTNDPPGKIGEALRSRFYVIMCPQIIRAYHEVIDYFGSSSSDMKRMRKNTFILHSQIEQYLVAITYKMIWAGVLCDVNMSICHRVFHAVLKEMEKDGVRVNDPRHYTRLLNTARTLSILRAIEIVFHLPSSSEYDKPFSLDSFILLEPHLICTEEIAYFTLTLMSDQYVNPFENKVIEALCKASKFPMDQKLWDADEKPIVNFKQDDSGVNDYNYISIPGNIWDVATIASGLMSKEHKSSKENIHAILKSMTERKIVGHHRIAPGESGKTDKKNEFMLVVSTRKETFISVTFIERMLDNSKSFSMMNCIRKTFHKHTRARRIILGSTQINSDCPHVFHVMQTFATDKYMRVSNIDWTPDSNEQPEYIVNTCLERLEVDKHIDNLYRDASDYNQPIYFDEITQRTYDDTMMDTTSKYPDKLILAIEHRKNTHKRMAGHISEEDHRIFSISNTRKRRLFTSDR